MFEEFCQALPLSQAQRGSISSRTASITRRLNNDFRSTASDTANRFYAGSYGRNTALASTSDIDLMYVLPYSVYAQYDAYANNKQSALLQAVRASLNLTYPNSAVVADGQIVKIGFVDNIVYEIVPVFVGENECYVFPDSNSGGSWRSCKPKHEVNEFFKRDTESNGNLVVLGRMARQQQREDERNAHRHAGLSVHGAMGLSGQVLSLLSLHDPRLFRVPRAARSVQGLLARAWEPFESGSDRLFRAAGARGACSRVGCDRQFARSAVLGRQEEVQTNLRDCVPKLI